jgi:hypothetical protein
MKEEQKIKDCPFCGGAVYLSENLGYHDQEECGQCVGIQCNFCGATIEEYWEDFLGSGLDFKPLGPGLGQSIDQLSLEIIEKWNRRA